MNPAQLHHPGSPAGSGQTSLEKPGEIWSLGLPAGKSDLLQMPPSELAPLSQVPAVQQSEQNFALAGPSALESIDWPVLSAMLMFIVAGSMLLKHWRESGSGQAGRQTSLRVVETLSLGPRGSLTLVECADSRALVGCDLHGVRSITVLPRAFQESLKEFDESPNGLLTDQREDPSPVSALSAFTPTRRPLSV